MNALTVTLYFLALVVIAFLGETIFGHLPIAISELLEKRRERSNGENN